MNPKTSQDLFNKIRSQFNNIRIGDENGTPTADPEKATFFEFEFKEDADTFGSVSISLADGENMKVFYNRNLVDKIDEDSKDEWYAFLKELKDFAVEHQLSFDVRDITKSNLTKQDYQNLADTNKTVNTDEMSEELKRITKLAGVTEGLTGSAKRSYENLDKTKLIIRHTGKVDETIPGSRSRQIQSLYIENEDGERFKYPLTHLAGARAMMRHVANGGRPHDEFGQHIVSTSEDIAKLNSFSRYVSNKDQLNDNAGDIIEQTKLKLENLREYMRNLSKQSHYENASKDFKTSEEQVLDDETVNKLREKFTMTNLDSRVEDAFPLISRVMSELENAPKAKFDQYGAMVSMPEPTDKMADLNSKMKQTTLSDHLAKAANVDKTKVYFDDVDLVWGSKTVKQGALIDKEYTFADAVDELKTFADANPKAEGQVNELDPGDEPIDAEPEEYVDAGEVVKKFLADPNTKIYLNNKMPDEKIMKRPGEDKSDAAIRMRLSDIASRMLTRTPDEDRVANFASRVADQMSQKGEPFAGKDMVDGPGFDSRNRDLAKALAMKYIKTAQEIDPQEFKAKKDIKGKPKETEAFESWADEVTNEYAKMGDFPRDKEIEKKDKENAPKLQVRKADKMMNNPAYQRMKAGDPRYVDKTDEEMSDKAVDKFHKELDNVVHKHIGHSSDEKKEKDKMKKEAVFPEGTTFEDIKPYVSMYRDEKGKIVNDVLDKDGNSVFKTHDGKLAMAYLSKNFDKLKNPVKEANPELDRITALANYQ